MVEIILTVGAICILGLVGVFCYCIIKMIQDI